MNAKKMQIVRHESLNQADALWRANCKLQIENCGGEAHPSFPRSAWERNGWPLRGRVAPPSTRSVGIVRSHAERGNEPPLPAPRSPLAAPRLGITLTEVLISMGILTLGLLGVAALFPVGGFYMQKAEISDRGSAIAQAVMSDIVSRGMLNPGAWYVMVPSPARLQANSPNYFFSGIDGKYSPRPKPAQTGDVAATFTRPLAEALSAGLKQSTDAMLISRQFGNAYVIDPMYVAAVTVRDVADGQYNPVAYPFPASALTVFPKTGGTWNYYKAPQWETWRSPQGANERTWPIRRVTFRDTSGWSADPTVAEHFCRAQDDLATDLPDRDDRPAIQNWDAPVVGSNQTPLARQWTGDYSWIATVLPTSIAARDGIARNPESFAYDVSVVVFHKRTLPAEPAASIANSTPARASERSVAASVLSTGLNGGELLLTDTNDNPVSAFEHLKSGHWIMLCGPHPNTTLTEPRFVLNWYQVLSIDSSGSGFNPQMQRIVAVRGPQWPWLPQGDPINDNDKLSNSLCVAICRGAVAVHTKTLRLEGPRGSAWSINGGGGGAGGVFGGASGGNSPPPPNYGWY